MMDEHLRANRAVWDEWTGINASSDFYNLATFKAGRCSLKTLELEELGDVRGKRLLHLQCHFGMDTLSWSRLGALVTGVDFSPRAVELAQSLSRELDLPARFVCCNLYDLPQQLDPAEKFDIVFTSYGALTWLPDRRRWAQIAASYLRPGGVFYIAEFHPFSMVFNEETATPVVKYPYFDEGMMAFPVQGSYADPSAETVNKTTYEWNYPLGEVVSELIAAGLQIEFLHEWPFACYPMFPYLVEGPDGLFRMPPGQLSLPLEFSIRAVKE
jgi:SAM-dependent methyltransferase